MKIVLELMNEEYFIKGIFTFTIDWNHPYLPRTGDELSTSFLVNHIDPDTFHRNLCLRNQEDYKEQVMQLIHKRKITFQTASEDILKEWLGNLLVRVGTVCWHCDGEHPYVVMSLETTS